MTTVYKESIRISSPKSLPQALISSAQGTTMLGIPAAVPLTLQCLSQQHWRFFLKPIRNTNHSKEAMVHALMR